MKQYQTNPKLIEMYKPYTDEMALQEASRCLMCEDAPCEKGCPAGVPVKEFIRNIRFRNYRAAYELIMSANIWGPSCGRICNSRETCQKNCTSEKLLRPIEIQKLQQFVCDQFVGERAPIVREPSTKKKVAIIGGGPAGLSVAFELFRKGLDITLYEKDDYLGGVIYNGIPAYRIPNDFVSKEIAWAENLAAQNNGFQIIKGKPAPSVAELSNQYDSVVIAVGLEKSTLPNIPGNKLKGVLLAKDVLRAHKLHLPIELGKKVIVVGGGNAAVDAAQAAYSMSGAEVTLVYRRSENEMPAWEREIEIAKYLGIQFRFLTAPLEVLGKQQVSGLKCQLLEPSSKKDQDGRTSFIPLQDATFTLTADTIIFGIGEKVDSDFFTLNQLQIKSGTHQTNLKNVFAVGDIMEDDKSVVHAVHSAKECSQVVLKHLGIKSTQKNIKADYYKHTGVDLTTYFCGVKFENPFVLAAAPPTDDLDMVKSAFRAGWAGAVLKTTSIESNNVPLKYPMMSGVKYDNKNLMGLGNIDLISEHHIDVIEKRVRELKKEFPTKVVIGSIMGEKKEDWQTLVNRLEAAGVDIIECSFSCPQGTLGSKPGFMLGQDPKLVKTVASWIKGAAKRVPVVIKITPQVADIVEIATAVKESGADAICASNSIPSLMGINLENFIPYPNVGGKSTYSGYTGAAIKPITLRNIAEIKRHVNIPITGTGGPVNWSDAIELMAVGASNVQFCTAVMHYGFDLINDLCSGLTYYMQKHKIKAVSELVGRSLPYITTHDELTQKSKVVSHIDPKKCVSCGACFVACRDGGHQAIAYDNQLRLFKTDNDKCVGCSFCPSVCPVENCLTMKEL